MSFVGRGDWPPAGACPGGSLCWADMAMAGGAFTRTVVCSSSLSGFVDCAVGGGTPPGGSLQGGAFEGVYGLFFKKYEN